MLFFIAIFTFLGPLLSHTNFKPSFSNVMKKGPVDFDWNYIEFADGSGISDISHTDIITIFPFIIYICF